MRRKKREETEGNGREVEKGWRTEVEKKVEKEKKKLEKGRETKRRMTRGKERR